jgi:hypothetical protein
MNQDDDKKAVYDLFMQFLLEVYRFVVCLYDQNFVNHDKKCQLDE